MRTPPGGQPSPIDARCAAILDGLPSPVLVVDRDGRVVLFNRACAALSGMEQAEARDQVLWELLAVPEERNELRAAFDKVFADGQPRAHEQHCTTRGGESKLLRFTNTALLGSDGNVEFVVAGAADITASSAELVARESAERALRDSEAKSKAILHALPDLMFRLGADGVFREFLAPNERDLAVPPDRIVGHSLEELLPADVARGRRHRA